MSKKSLLLSFLLLANLFIAPTTASADASTHCESLGINISVSPDPTQGERITTNDPIFISLSHFNNPNEQPDKAPYTYSILISTSNGDPGTKLKDVPGIGGALSSISDFSILGVNIGAPVKGLLDITLPVSFSDDNSQSGDVSSDDIKKNNGSADFSLPALSQGGPYVPDHPDQSGKVHYIKIQSKDKGGSTSTVCVFNNPTINVIDARDVTAYQCLPAGNDPERRCEVGSGEVDLANGCVQTAIGCVPYDPAGLINGLFSFVLRAAGGIALLIMAFSAIGMITSQGSGDALKHSQERFRDAIIGLIFIILAITILQIIGIDILQIPGLTR